MQCLCENNKIQQIYDKYDETFKSAQPKIVIELTGIMATYLTWKLIGENKR